MSRNLVDQTLPADGELVTAAAAGDKAAFDELYRRHSEAAWRVAFAVTGNRDDAADAVAEAFTRMLTALAAGRLVEVDRIRSYLLATTRNAAIDVLRRSGRLQPLDELPQDRFSSLTAGPFEQLIDGVDASLVASAFLGLPERWRSVLWLTEVEDMAPAEAAALLGVSANNAAQLASRARAGLRQRFLQAHVAAQAGEECSFTRERLGAYVGGSLSPRDLAKVDQHLAGCAGCRGQLSELEDLGTTLRRVALPLPLALGGLVWEHWKAVSREGTKAAAALAPRGHRALTGTSVGLLGLGVIALGILGHPGDGAAGGPVRPPTEVAVGSRPVLAAEAAAQLPPQATVPALPLVLPGTGTPTGGGTSLPPTPTTSAPATAAAGTAGAPASSGAPSGTGTAPASTTPALPVVIPTSSGPTLQLSTQINLAPAPVTASLGAGAGGGASSGVSVTTPIGSENAGTPPTTTSTSATTPSVSVSATTPVTGTSTSTINLP